jgi:hypothetical protein
MGQLKPLQAVAVLGFAAHDVHDGIHQFGSFRVMSFSPIVAWKTRNRLSRFRHAYCNSVSPRTLPGQQLFVYLLRSGQKRSCRA